MANEQMAAADPNTDQLIERSHVGAEAAATASSWARNAHSIHCPRYGGWDSFGGGANTRDEEEPRGMYCLSVAYFKHWFTPMMS